MDDIVIIIEETVSDIVVVVEYPQPGGVGIEDIEAGSNVLIDKSNPKKPKISATGDLVSGVATLGGEFVNNNDPLNPIIEGVSDAIAQSTENKIDKDGSKQLSDENYTLLEKQKLATLENFDDSEILTELEGKVDKVNGKGLSDQNYTLTEKQKLEELENYNDTEIQSEISNKVDKVTGKGLSDENYSTTEKSKLASLENFDDSGIQSQLGNKVDKEAGKGLSKNDYTDAEKSKLAGLESPKYKGQFISLKALIDANVGEEGANSYVDEGEGFDVVNYIWDSSDAEWIVQQGASTSETPSSIKSKYESNADTNVFTDSEKDKLVNIEDEATKNDTDANLKNRVNHTGTQAISTITGLQTELDEKVVKVEGKGLSNQNYTLTEKNKLASITAIFTTALKNAYDNVVTWISNNGENLLNHLTATNPHNITKNTIGLPNADNTSDTNKPLSNDAIAALSEKVDKVAGKVLSTNDFDNDAKNKLSGINLDPVVVPVTANKTLALTDAKIYTFLYVTANANLTIPANSSVAFPIGSTINISAGNVTSRFVAASGVTLIYETSDRRITPNTAASSLKLDTNTWMLIGKLIA